MPLTRKAEQMHSHLTNGKRSACKCRQHQPGYSCCRFLPYVGQVTIIMNDYPYLKYLLIGVLGLFVIMSKEQ